MWAVGTWVVHIEKLFRDLYTEERDNVHLAAHCLETGASSWWGDLLQHHYEGFPEPPWEEFTNAIYNRYLKDNTKESLA